MNKYELQSDYFIPSLCLYISNAVFKDGLIASAYVVNGDWWLKRDGDEWHCCDYHKHVVNRRTIRPEDDQYQVFPKRMNTQSDDNEYEYDDDIPF